MGDKHFGSCLCGNVKFEIDGEFEHFFLCHCGGCQKGTGSAHASNLFSSTAKVHWLSGQAKIRNFHVPSTRHQKSFCSECGSPLPTVQSEVGLLVVPAGSLNTAIARQPDAHIFSASSASWDQGLHEIPKFDTQPS